MWYKYTAEFYSALKDGILLFAGKWRELDVIVLNDVRKTQNKSHDKFSHIYVTYSVCVCMHVCMCLHVCCVCMCIC